MFPESPTAFSTMRASRLRILTYDMIDIVVLSAEGSCLAAPARAAAKAIGLPIVSGVDRQAELARSDQFAFLRAGVPAVMPMPGPGGDGLRATAAFLTRHYHRPSDDMTQSIDWSAADRYSTFVWRLVQGVADRAGACALAMPGNR